jgi:hypothetical protein
LVYCTKKNLATLMKMVKCDALSFFAWIQIIKTLEMGQIVRKMKL